MSGVTARFFVASITRFAGDHGTVTLNAATRGEENRAWASATPSGKIELSITNPDALAWFEEQRVARTDIALTFTVAP